MTLLLLALACAPKDETDTAVDSGDSGSLDSGDSADSGDTADTGDTGDTADSGDSGDTGDTADSGDTGDTGVDADGDGYDADVDCVDDDPAINPGAAEVCNLLDDNCNGAIDDNATDVRPWYADDDGDGFGTTALVQRACTAPRGLVDNPNDCDDTNAAINPAATEVCNGLDDDCDISIDEGATDGVRWFADTDGDGYGSTTNLTACAAPAGFVNNSADCNDTDAAINPGAEEVCNSVDDDCDLQIDDNPADGTPYYADLDGDGYGDPDVTSNGCDGPPRYYVAEGTDCADSDPTVNPGEIEVCNGQDDDCDGTIDQGAADPATWYPDLDLDGYGDGSLGVADCAAPDGYLADGRDCADGDPSIHPGVAETCDGVDQDCDGVLDNAAIDGATYYADVDDDGFGDPSVTTTDCSLPAGYRDDATDCDDADALTYPGADERCDSRDNDCDGAVDEDPVDPPTFYADTDADGYGDPSVTDISGCSPADGFVADATDCDDSEWDTNPGMPELCNDWDDNCDGNVDGDFQVPEDYLDIGDAVAAASAGDTVCVSPGYYDVRSEIVVDKDLTIAGFGGGSDTHLSAGYRSRILSASGVSLTLYGLRLTDGFAENGGCVALVGADTVLEQVTLENCGTLGVGGALYVEGGSLSLTQVDLWSNYAYADGAVGGALQLFHADTTMDQVSFIGNYGESSAASGGSCEGGAAHVQGGGNTLRLTNVELSSNGCYFDGPGGWADGVGLLTDATDVVATNVTIDSNLSSGGADARGVAWSHTSGSLTLDNASITSNTGDGAAFSAMYVEPTASLTVWYTNTYGNDDVAWEGWADPTGVDGNISVDPGYTRTTGSDPSQINLRLASGSALIDAGDPALLDADGSTSDIGAYGGAGGAW